MDSVEDRSANEDYRYRVVVPRTQVNALMKTLKSYSDASVKSRTVVEEGRTECNALEEQISAAEQSVKSSL